MGLTDPDADRHRRHSMVLVPRDTPGVKVERMLSAMGMYDEPLGHGEVVVHRRARARRPRILPARAGRSRSPRAGSARAACTTACGWSGWPRWRSSSPATRVDQPRRVRQAAGQPRRQPRAASPTPASPSTRPGCSCCTRPGSSTPSASTGALSEVSQIKVAVPQHGAARSSTWPCSCTAAAGCPTTSRSPPPGSAPARCGWPTAPTRCTAAWSPGTSLRPYAARAAEAQGVAR